MTTPITLVKFMIPNIVRSQVFFVLYEHAVGYTLFRCQDVEDIGSMLPEVQEAVTDYSRFTEMVSLEAFSPFKSGTNALDNINSISEGN